MSLDAWFKGRPPELRRIYDAVARHVRKLGEVHIEAVGIGFLIKRKRTIAELRPRRVGFGLSFVLRREVSDARITRRLPMSGGQVYPVVPLSRNLTLNVAVLSYCGQLHFGLLGDGASGRDLQRLAGGIEDGFDELHHAAVAPPPG